MTANTAGSRRANPRPGLRESAASRAVSVAVVLLAALVALVPEWEPIWYQDDQLPSVFRTLHTDLAHHQGIVFPRMAFELGFGYGQLLHQVYPPLGFELTAWFHALGLGYIDAVRAFFSLCLVLGALGMLGYGRAVLGGASGGGQTGGGQIGPVLAAVAYVWAPYTLLDAHPGGDFGESLAIALLPWSVWAFHALLMRGTWARFGAAALALAAVNLAHNITALFLTGLTCLYIGGLVVRTLRQHGRRAAQAALVRASAAMLLALALAAIYWAPALLEIGYSRIGEQRQGSFDLQEYLQPIDSLLQSSLVYGYHLEGQHQFGLAHFLVTVAAMVVMGAALRRRRSADHRPDLLVLAACAALFVGVLALQLRGSELIWNTVPLISFVQFPRRLFVFATFAAAVLIGALPWAIGQLGVPLAGRLTVAGLVAAVFAATGLPGIYWPPPVSQSHRISEDLVANGSSADQRFSQRSAYDDFMPKWVTERQTEIGRPPSRTGPYERANELPPPRVELLEWSYRRAHMVTEADTTSAVVLHRFYFPGWRATASGAPVTVEPVGPLGLTRVTIPPGRHEIIVTYGDTPLRIGAMLVSLVAAGLTVLVLGRGLGFGRVAVGLGAIMVVVLAPWGVHLTAAAPARPQIERHDLEVTPAARIIGVEREDRTYRPGDTVQVIVHWQATEWTRQDLRSGIQLAAQDADAVLAERWSRPNLGRTPTAKWVLGLLVPDSLSVEVPEDARPGRYRVLAGLRDSAATTVQAIGEIVVLDR